MRKLQVSEAVILHWTCAWFCKHTTRSCRAIYAAFIDYKMVFDSISCNRLWRNLETSTINHRLLGFICTQTICQWDVIPEVVCPSWFQSGEMWSRVAPLLPVFIWHINSMMESYSNPNFHLLSKQTNRHTVICRQCGYSVLHWSRFQKSPLLCLLKRGALTISLSETNFFVFFLKN